MPRTYPPRRTHVAFRIGEAGLTAVDALASREGVDRSEMLRRLIREAMEARHEAIGRVVRDGPTPPIPDAVPRAADDA